MHCPPFCSCWFLGSCPSNAANGKPIPTRGIGFPFAAFEGHDPRNQHEQNGGQCITVMMRCPPFGSPVGGWFYCRQPVDALAAATPGAAGMITGDSRPETASSCWRSLPPPRCCLLY